MGNGNNSGCLASTQDKGTALSSNTNARHYFYVTDKSYNHLGELADELYGCTLTLEQPDTRAWVAFIRCNWGAGYLHNPIPSGAWVLIPNLNYPYGFNNILKFNKMLTHSSKEQLKLAEEQQKRYGQGVKLLGYAYFDLDQQAEFLENNPKLVQVAEDINLVWELHKPMDGHDSIDLQYLPAQAKSKLLLALKKIRFEIEKIGKSFQADISRIEADTSLVWRKSLLSMKTLGMADTEIEGLQVMIAKGVRIAKQSSLLDKLLMLDYFSQVKTLA